MPLWLAIPLAVCCWFSAIMQVRMSLIYSGKIDSPVTGFYRGQGGNATLRSIAIRSAISCSAYGIIFLTVPWPTVLTFIAIIWTSNALFDFVLFWFGAGVYSIDMNIVKLEARRGVVVELVARQLALLAFKGCLVGLCIYFFG
jgi:hypothetical protein